MISPHRIIFGVLYWLVLAVILPWLGGYWLDEATDVLQDGTPVTKLIHVPRDDDGVGPV